MNVDTVGVSPGLFGGWRATFEFFHHVNDWMVEGYKKVIFLQKPLLTHDEQVT